MLSLVPLLSDLLERTEEAILEDEVVRALINIGTEEVIQEVERHLLNGDAAYPAIQILERIKFPLAEDVLLRNFEQITDITIKTLAAEALCNQLSTKAIPLIESFIEEGYDKGMLDLEESLYACCVINQINHPKIDIWKQRLTQKNAGKLGVISTENAPMEKAGRNDPCPCGSGKKFKKCCM